VKKREFFKFLCGFLAGAGVVHANMGFGIAAGMFNEPHYLGHTWSATALWIGAAGYLIVSAIFGYLGWRKQQRGTPKPVRPFSVGPDGRL